MELSLLLAKMMGAYIVIVTVGLLANRKRYLKTIQEFKNTVHMTITYGFVAIVLGLIIVFTHNIWVSDWRTIVTVLGWLVLAKGITYFIFPHWLVKLAVKINKTLLFSLLVPFFALGVYLLYVGFAG